MARQASSEENVAHCPKHINTCRLSKHCGKDPCPVVGVGWDEGKEENGNDFADPGHDKDGTTWENMQQKSTRGREDEAAHRPWSIPNGSQESRLAQNNVNTAIMLVDPSHRCVSIDEVNLLEVRIVEINTESTPGEK